MEQPGQTAARLPGLRYDRSVLLLAASNLFTILLAVIQKWNFLEVLWIYWGQSMIIGFFNWLRIRQLRQFTTDHLLIDNKPVAPTEATKRQVGWFFAAHYGFFHLVYMGYLVGLTVNSTRPNLLTIGMCIAVFAANHFFSYRHNLEDDLRRRPNIGTMMFFPYARIVPMHLTIIFGSFFAASAGPMVFFLLLKTLADVVMHLVEHRGECGPEREK